MDSPSPATPPPSQSPGGDYLYDAPSPAVATLVAGLEEAALMEKHAKLGATDSPPEPPKGLHLEKTSGSTVTASHTACSPPLDPDDAPACWVDDQPEHPFISTKVDIEVPLPGRLSPHYSDDSTTKCRETASPKVMVNMGASPEPASPKTMVNVGTSSGIFEEDHMNLVAPRLWLGDLVASLDGSMLAAHGIRWVVDLANAVVDPRYRGQTCYEVSRDDPAGEDWAAACPSIESRLVVAVDDVEDAIIDDKWPMVDAFVARVLAQGGGSNTDEAGSGNVLVHCVRGKSRSACTVVAHLMAVRGLSLRLAMREVHNARPTCSINTGFKRQLQALESRLRPGEEPSIVLKLASKKPKSLSSAKDARAAYGAARVEDKSAPLHREPTPQTFTMEDSTEVLKSEAKRRGLPTGGTKRQVFTRIQKSLEAENQADGPPGAEKEANPGVATSALGECEAAPTESSSSHTGPASIRPGAPVVQPVAAGEMPSAPLSESEGALLATDPPIS